MKHIIQELLEADDQNEDIEIRSYSGRGMFGRHCLAAVARSDTDVLRSLFRGLSKNPTSEACVRISEDLEDMKVDSLGHDFVVYWPNIPFGSSPTEEDEEDLEAENFG